MFTRYFAYGMVLLFIPYLYCCKSPVAEQPEEDVEKELRPTLHSEDVKTLISDSGVTKYRITAKVWEVFDKTVSPYWYFPEKIYVEKFDSLYNTEASIESDTAYFFSNEKLWRLVGNVEVHNQKDEKFFTEELFWDQKKQKIYSDKFIHIERPERIIEGYGFISDEAMNDYQIINVSGIFDVEDDQNQNNPYRKEEDEIIEEEIVE